MKSWFVFFAAIIILFFCFRGAVFAESSYVLPYPSAMPGSTTYKIHLVLEKIMKYWYFGNFSQFKYNLQLSDKYLVEAKTLFEYKQYLLGFYALEKSDMYFNEVPIYLQASKKEGKNITENEKILKSASQKHVEVLSEISKDIPSFFIWNPEKGGKVELNLKKEIDNSTKIRAARL